MKMLLTFSIEMFDEGQFTENDAAVFIDLAEKLLDAKPEQTGNWVFYVLYISSSVISETAPSAPSFFRPSVNPRLENI